MVRLLSVQEQKMKPLTAYEFGQELRKYLLGAHNVRICGWDKEVDDSVTIGVLEEIAPNAMIRAIVEHGRYNPRLDKLAELKKTESIPQFKFLDTHLPTTFKIIDEEYIEFVGSGYIPEKSTVKRLLMDGGWITGLIASKFDQLYDSLGQANQCLEISKPYRTCPPI